MFRKFLAVVVPAVLGVSAASAQTIFGSAYSGSGGAASLYSISPATGAGTLVGPIGFAQVGSLAFATNGTTLYGAGLSGSTAVLITINTATGAGTLVGSTSDVTFQDIALRYDGTLFGFAGGDIYTINTSTGAATLVGATGKGFPDGNALAFSPSGVLYTANQTELDSINQTTGVATTVVALTYSPSFGTGESRAAGMKFSSSGVLYAAVVNGNPGTIRSLGTINISTGAVTDVGQTAAGMDGLAIANVYFSPPSTPAPPTLLLAGIGVLLVGLYVNRKALLDRLRG